MFTLTAENVACFVSRSIDFDVFPDPHILGILELHPARETGVLSFF
jgi:hypothetical protein